jgi:hypothetical protein
MPAGAIQLEYDGGATSFGDPAAPCSVSGGTPGNFFPTGFKFITQRFAPAHILEFPSRWLDYKRTATKPDAPS